MADLDQARLRLDKLIGFNGDAYRYPRERESKRLTLAADRLTDSPELRRERDRLDKLLPAQCNEDWLRMQLASDVIVGKESYIKQLEIASDCELLAEGHLALVSEYGLEYGTTPTDLQERRGERANHAAWVIMKLKGDLKDARQGGALFAAMHEADTKVIAKLTKEVSRLNDTILALEEEAYLAVEIK